MVREADPNDVDLVGHPLRVPIEELGGDALGGTENPAQWASQS
jgi:hypothetical protein